MYSGVFLELLVQSRRQEIEIEDKRRSGHAHLQVIGGAGCKNLSRPRGEVPPSDICCDLVPVAPGPDGSVAARVSLKWITQQTVGTEQETSACAAPTRFAELVERCRNDNLLELRQRQSKPRVDEKCLMQTSAAAKCVRIACAMRIVPKQRPSHSVRGWTDRKGQRATQSASAIACVPSAGWLGVHTNAAARLQITRERRYFDCRQRRKFSTSSRSIENIATPSSVAPGERRRERIGSPQFSSSTIFG